MTPIDRLLAICSLPADDDTIYCASDPPDPPKDALTYSDLRELAKLHQELIAENERLHERCKSNERAHTNMLTKMSDRCKELEASLARVRERCDSQVSYLSSITTTEYGDGVLAAWQECSKLLGGST